MRVMGEVQVERVGGAKAQAYVLFFCLPKPHPFHLPRPKPRRNYQPPIEEVPRLLGRSNQRLRAPSERLHETLSLEKTNGCSK